MGVASCPTPFGFFSKVDFRVFLTPSFSREEEKLELSKAEILKSEKEDNSEAALLEVEARLENVNHQIKLLNDSESQEDIEQKLLEEELNKKLIKMKVGMENFTRTEIERYKKEIKADTGLNFILLICFCIALVVLFSLSLFFIFKQSLMKKKVHSKISSLMEMLNV